MNQKGCHFMQQKAQHQYQDQRIVHSSIPRISSQNSSTRPREQLQETAERGAPLLLIWLEQLSHTMQIIVGVIAVLIVSGIITLFILAALFPNAYIGIAGLFSSIGTFIGGFLAGKVAKPPQSI
jgi:hypothetical protein